MKFWRRKHRHDWKSKSQWSGAAVVASWQECECGESTAPELTPAGGQQIGWWMQIHPEWDPLTVTNGVKYGLLPHPFIWTGEQPDGTLGRVLTAEEADELIALQAAMD